MKSTNVIAKNSFRISRFSHKRLSLEVSYTNKKSFAKKLLQHNFWLRRTQSFISNSVRTIKPDTIWDNRLMDGRNDIAQWIAIHNRTCLQLKNNLINTSSRLSYPKYEEWMWLCHDLGCDPIVFCRPSRHLRKSNNYKGVWNPNAESVCTCGKKLKKL